MDIKEKTIIVGLDLSISSSGCVKLTLDSQLNVVDMDYLGFVDKKYQDVSDHLIFYNKKHFANDFERFESLSSKVVEFAKGADYVNIEDYAMKGKGRVFHIGEFSGLIKYPLYDNYIALRLTDPLSLKLFATGSGSTSINKVDMFESALGHPDWPLHGIAELPPEGSRVYPIGKSPGGDICDAWWLAKLLQVELKLRFGLISMSDLHEHVIKVFNRVTKTYPVNILGREFLKRKSDNFVESSWTK